MGGEVVYPVPPLSVPDPEAEVGVADLEAYDGVRLFLQRAAATMPGQAVGSTISQNTLSREAPSTSAASSI